MKEKKKPKKKRKAEAKRKPKESKKKKKAKKTTKDSSVTLSENQFGKIMETLSPKKKKAKKETLQVPGYNFSLPTRREGQQLAIKRYLMSQDSFLWTGPRSRPYMYSRKLKHWSNKIGDSQILQDCEDITNAAGISNPTIGDNVLKSICRSSYQPISVFDSSPYQHTVGNGIIDLANIKENTLKFIKGHHPEEYHLQSLQWDYDRESKCPKVIKFLKEIIPKHIKAIQEFVGSCLIKDYAIKTSLMFVGRTNSGRTTLIQLIQRFLGAGNYCDIPLRELSWPYKGADLHGKLANFGDDLSARDIRDVSFFKKAVGDGVINARRIYEHPFEFTSYAKQLHAANRLPFVLGADLAFYERWFTLDFESNFPKGGQKTKNRTKLINNICTPKEMSGMLNWAIRGLARLMRQGRYTGDYMTPRQKMIDWRERATEAKQDAKFDGFDASDKEDIHRRNLNLVYNYIASRGRSWPDGGAIPKGRFYRDFCKKHKSDEVKETMSKKRFGTLVARHMNIREGPHKRIKGKKGRVETWIWVEK